MANIVNFSYREFLDAVIGLREEGYSQPHMPIAVSFRDEFFMMEPHYRPHHYKAWPLPIYHNDNIQ